MIELMTQNTATGLTALAVYIISLSWFISIKEDDNILHYVGAIIFAAVLTCSVGLIPILVVGALSR